VSAEITLNLLFSFAKAASSGGTSVAITPTFTGTQYIHHRQSIGTAEEAIVLGEATGGGGYAVFINRDPTNFIQLRQATGAAAFAKLLPGEFACFRISPSMTAPFAIADTAACQMEYWILVA